jgi:hypothetical protein
MSEPSQAPDRQLWRNPIVACHDAEVPNGEVARAEVGNALAATKRGEAQWSDDYRCVLRDGSTLQIQVDEHDRLIRAVVFDATGAQVDATESTPNPPASYAVAPPIHRLRLAIDEQLRRG